MLSTCFNRSCVFAIATEMKLESPKLPEGTWILIVAGKVTTGNEGAKKGA